MKHSIFVKFIAIALCAAALLAAVAGGLGIILMAENGLYDRTPEELYKERLEENAYWLAQQIAQNYASTNLGGCPEEMLGHYYYFDSGCYGYTLKDATGQVLEHVPVEDGAEAYDYSFTVSGSYMKVESAAPMETQPQYSVYDRIPEGGALVYTIYYDTGDAPESMGSDMPIGILEHDEEGFAIFTAMEPHILDLYNNEELMEVSFHDQDGEPIYALSGPEPIGYLSIDQDGIVRFEAYEVTGGIVAANTEAVAINNDTHRFSYYDNEQGCEMVVEYTWEVMPEYRVDMLVLPEAGGYYYDYTLLAVVSAFRNILPVALAAGLLVFAITAVYLCCAAGRRPGTDEVRPAGLNRIPLDLYLGIACLLLCGLFFLAAEGGGELVRQNVPVGLGFIAMMGYLAALVIVGCCFAFAAQVKSKGGYWWRHMVLGWCFGQVLRFFRWLGRGMKWLRNGIRGVYNLLPIIWQWLVAAACMVAAVGITALLSIASYGFGEIFWALVCAVCVMGSVVVVIYGGWCFGTLLKGAQNMAQGNLNYKVPTEHMYGAFGDFAEELNNLAQGAKIAAERQMKSERMKTELITNVSHDIKTPLTSIINYVDLLKKPHSDAETAQYLDVLDRQSQRLKKLIDDLMEMSKASTGNLSVELGQVDAVEAVNQALGEFADKLNAVNLTPVFRHPQEPVMMRADGRLVWRVLSNLLSNAYKYALPDTRLYIDLMMLQGNAVIAIKNISREQLNVGADELMERFVRGDTSRNTEGSGLGLNIAKSLVELQQGQMHLMVDGDLFKVTLIFPLC